MNVANLVPQLAPILLDASSNLPKARLMFVEEETPLDGSFIFHYLSSIFMRAKGDIIFVCANETRAHYTTVSAKLGLMFSRMVDQKRLTFVEVDKIIKRQFDAGENILHVIMTEIMNALDLTVSRDVPTQTLLIVDSASLLLDLCGNVSQVMSFYKDLNKLSEITTICTLATRINNVEPNDLYSYLLHSLRFKADARFILTAIGSGFSKDVTGQIRIEQIGEYETMPRISEFHYKLGDRSIQLIAPGLYNPALVE